MKKTSITATALLLITGTLLCSCAKNTNVSETDLSQAETYTAESVGESSAETAAAESTTEATETTGDSMTEIAETTEVTGTDWRDVTEFSRIELDGVEEDHVITTDYCYIESEKYVMFLDKDLELPGDFVTNVDAIIDEIELETGLVACPEGEDYGTVINMAVYFDGDYPWSGVSIGNKIPIFIFVDHNDEGWISSACESFATFVSYELYSDDYWMSHYSRDEDWRRMDYIDYTTIAHELTHTITQRQSDMTTIMTEGAADFMGRSVISALADTYPSIGETNEKRYIYDEGIPAPVNSGNAEAIFLGDYNDISTADRGAEYVTGRYFCQFLYEKYGNGFLADYLTALQGKNLPYVYENYDESVVADYIGTLKEVYGEDVFTEFGDWCVANNVLQSTQGVW